jgi:hypothetical protein
MGGYIGELVALIILGLYAIGDHDGWGKRPHGSLRRVLVCVHGVLVLAAVDIMLFVVAGEPDWLRIAIQAANLLLFPLLAFAVFKSFPVTVGRMLQVIGLPLVYGLAIAVTGLVSQGLSLAQVLEPERWSMFVAGFGLPYFAGAGLGYAWLLKDQKDPGPLLEQEGTFWFWAALVAAFWAQGLGVWVVLLLGVAEGGAGTAALWAAETVVAAVHIGLLMRRKIPTGV